jgi:hypothetical protein
MRPCTSARILSASALHSLGLVGMHEDARLLQEHRAAKTGAQDEVPLEHGAALAEHVDHLVARHLSSPSLPPQPLTRDTLDAFGRARSWAMMPVEMLQVEDFEIDQPYRWASSPLRIILTVIDVAVVLADHLGDAGERTGLVDRGRPTIWAGKRSLRPLGSTSQRTSTQRSGSSSKAFRTGDWIG